MTEYADAAALAGTDEVSANTLDVTLPGGRKVTVRGLSRVELLLSGAGDADAALIEARNVAACMVNPKMTLGQVQAWQRNTGPNGGIARVSEAIRDLSGLGKGAAKSGVDEVRD